MSVPSLLIVLLDFVLKVLKLCLFFDELFRVRMSKEHHRNRKITKHKSPFLVTWDIFHLSYEDDVTWSRMPDNEVMMFVMRLGHWPTVSGVTGVTLCSVTADWSSWLSPPDADTGQCSAECTRASAMWAGQWPQSSHASFVHESGLTFFQQICLIFLSCVLPREVYVWSE